MTNEQVPISLKIVAVLFIIAGVLAVIEVITALANNNININLGVLNLFVGIGLLKLSPGWRTVGLVFLWLAMVFIPVFWFFVFFSDQQPRYFTKAISLVLIAALFALTVWQYKVLTRPDIRNLFGLPPK